MEHNQRDLQEQDEDSKPQPDPLAEPGPSRVPWPPLLSAAGLLFPWLLQDILPLPLLILDQWAGELQIAAAWAVAAWGAAIAYFGSRSLKGIGTNVSPTAPAFRLATFGPYAQTRNPIYLGLAIAFIGLAFATGNMWRFAFVPLFVMAVEALAIRPEETHLAERFPDEWPAYSARVRRWF